MSAKLLWSAPYPLEPRAVAISPNGRLVAAAGLDKKVRIFDGSSGLQVRSLDAGIRGWLYCVKFSPDGRSIAAAGVGKKIHFWDIATWRQLPGIRNHKYGTLSIAFSVDDRWLASGGSNQGVKLWDLSTGRQARTLLPTDDTVSSVAFSPNCRLLAAAKSNGKISVWDVATGKLAQQLDTNAQVVGFDPGGKIIASGDGWGTITFWNVADGKKVQSLSGRGRGPGGLAASPDGRWLAIATADRVNVWDASAGRVVASLVGQGYPTGALSFSPDGEFLASGDMATTIDVWRAPNWQKVRTLVGHKGLVTSLAFSPKGELLASGSWDKTIKLWDVSTWHKLHTFRGHTAQVDSLAFSHDGDLLASSGGSGSPFTLLGISGHFFDGSIRIWDLRTRRQVQALNRPPFPYRIFHIPKTPFTLWPVGRPFFLPVTSVNCDYQCTQQVAFSPDGKLLARSLADRITIWDTHTWREAKQVASEGTQWTGIAWDPEGAWFASSTTRGSIKLWDLASEKEVQSLSDHGTRVTGLSAFSLRRPATGKGGSKGGQWLASSSLDGTTRVWDPKSGRLRATLIAPSEAEDWVAITPDGFFDGAPGGWANMLWRFSPNLPDVDPIEIFFRDFFYWKLLPRILAGNALPEIPSLVSLNRTQPEVTITKIRADTSAPSTALVTVDVASASSRVQMDARGQPLQSGVYDVRLFRDGQMVAEWPTVAAGAEDVVLKDKLQKEREAWRQLHEVKLDASGRTTITFHHVRLPERAGVERVQFTAYAFNRDRVKSLTTPPYEYARPTSATAAVPRRAYLITMGVNANQSHNLDLELAVSSAKRAQVLLRGKLEADYSEVIEIPLYSDLAPDSSQVRLKTASKADLRAVLDLLAGRSVSPALRDEVDPKHQLQAASPDDAVVVYVASHGYADPEGTFYLMPYDTGWNWGVTGDVLTRCQMSPDQSTACKHAQDLLAHSVSSADLASWWNGVDAGELIMILDSCHSGAVPGKEFRPGPLGDPGFGQLSYDKGMQILSASQPAQTEQGEWVTGGGGRTLLVDTLETVAKANPQQTLEQWMHEMEQQLPLTVRQLYPALKEEDVQLPVLLDFGKRASTTIIAR